MAIKYVSQAATNGYVVGSDANDGSTKVLAKLTLDSAMSAAGIGDTIIINDGTYTSATFFNVIKALTINPENDYGVVLKRTGAQIRVLNVNCVGTVNLGKLVLDAEDNASTSSLSVSNAAGLTTLGLNGTKLKNTGAGAAAASISSTALNLNIVDIVLDGNCPRSGIYATLLQSGHIDIDGLTVDNSATSGATGTTAAPVVLIATVAGVTMRVRRCTGNWKSVGSSHAFILTRGIRGIIENNRGMRVTGTDTSAAIISCQNTGVLADNVVVRHNHGSNECPGQYLIMIGSDGASANDNKTNYPHVYKNDVSGSAAASLMHGLMFGNIKGGVCFGNYVRKAAIPLVSKLQTERAYFDDNDVDESPTSTSGCMRAKGSVNTDFVGNRIRLSAGNMNKPVVVNMDDAIPTYSSGVSVIGNHIYSPVTVEYVVALGGTGDTSAAEFMGNNWSAPDYGAQAWLVGTTYYDSLAAWKAAKELTANNVSPTTFSHDFWKLAYRTLHQSALAAVCPALLPLEY